jgi:hypothetical protein
VKNFELGIQFSLSCIKNIKKYLIRCLELVVVIWEFLAAFKPNPKIVSIRVFGIS